MAVAAKAGGGSTWAVTVLSALGVSPNTTNVLALKLWNESESYSTATNRGHYNWLDTTLTGYGGVSYNSAGVKTYPNFTAGVQATAAALKEPAYANIVKALSKTAGPTPTKKTNPVNRAALVTVFNAINTSTWCGHPSCRQLGTEGGHYPADLWTYLSGKGATAGGVHLTTPASTLKGTGTKAATTCLIKFPGVAGVGSFCVLSKSQGRALQGGLLVIAGGGVMLFGFVLMAAFGLGSSRAMRGVAQVQRGIGAPARVVTARRTQRARSTEARAREVRTRTRLATARARQATRDEADAQERAAGGGEGIRRSTTENRRIAREQREARTAEGAPHRRRRAAERRPAASRTIRV